MRINAAVQRGVRITLLPCRSWHALHRTQRGRAHAAACAVVVSAIPRRQRCGIVSPRPPAAGRKCSQARAESEPRAGRISRCRGAGAADSNAARAAVRGRVAGAGGVAHGDAHAVEAVRPRLLRLRSLSHSLARSRPRPRPRPRPRSCSLALSSSLPPSPARPLARPPALTRLPSRRPSWPMACIKYGL
jgi:hypothetical protein